MPEQTRVTGHQGRDGHRMPQCDPMDFLLIAKGKLSLTASRYLVKLSITDGGTLNPRGLWVKHTAPDIKHP